MEEETITIGIKKTTWRKINQFELDEDIKTHDEVINKLFDAFYKRRKSK